LSDSGHAVHMTEVLELFTGAPLQQARRGVARPGGCPAAPKAFATEGCVQASRPSDPDGAASQWYSGQSDERTDPGITVCRPISVAGLTDPASTSFFDGIVTQHCRLARASRACVRIEQGGVVLTVLESVSSNCLDEENGLRFRAGTSFFPRGLPISVKSENVL